MSKFKITLVLVAVTLSTMGLNAQNNQQKDIDIDHILNDVKYLLNDIDYRLGDKDSDLFRVVRNSEVRYGNLNRNIRKSTRQGRKRNSSFALDRYYPRRGTDNFVNVYVGLNNWLEDGDLPSSDQAYSLSPINSWYLGVNFDNISKIFGPLYVDWGVGISMQDFSFENTRVNVQREASGDPSSISFTEIEDISGRKSKINVTHLTAHFVPTISLGRSSGFRVGFGVYGGYRIGSHTKMKFDDVNGDKQSDKIKDSFHINPFKYGFRGQLGWHGFDLFFNYDLTEFFDEDVNAPRLTPVTFGVIF